MADIGNKESNRVTLLSDLDQKDPHLEKYLRYSIIYYLVISVIIGLPIWYFTTTTYRADLPFNTIEELKTSQIEFSITIDLIFLNRNIDNIKLSKYERDLFPKLYKHSSLANGFRILYKGKARLANEHEINLVSKSKNLLEFDKILSDSVQNKNVLKIFILNEEFSSKFNLKDESRFLNFLYTTEEYFQKDIDSIVQLILNDYLHVNQLSDIYKSKRSIRRRLPGKNELRKVEFDSDYEITFSYINSNPEQFKVDIDIESSIKNYFSPIINQLAAYTNISIKSQKLLYSDFDNYKISQKKPTTQTSNDGYYYLNPSDLSIMTNYIESRLGSQIQQSSTINFVTYIPLKQPLKILNSDQKLNQYNAFLVPRWGGIYIYNHLNEKNEDINIFLTQFLNLIGIDLHEKLRNEPRSKLYSTEILSYLLSKTLENILNSLNTLESLSSLLEKISNMVIDDDIAKQVYLSVDSIKNCLDLIKNNNLIEAFEASKIAFVSSEKAFFDPSLLELLYFPEDQKFAIYIPLFIPVGLPLVMSLITLLKKRKEKKD